MLDYFNITASFSKKGYPYDNAVCESFFKFLKKECTNRRFYAGFDDLKEDLFEYIEVFYNIGRPHSANNTLSPSEKENMYKSR